MYTEFSSVLNKDFLPYNCSLSKDFSCCAILFCSSILPPSFKMSYFEISVGLIFVFWTAEGLSAWFPKSSCIRSL